MDIEKFVLNETSYFGEGARKVLPEEIKKRGFKKVLVVTDESLYKAGVSTKITDLLEANKIDYVLLKADTVGSIYDRRALQKEYVETEDGKRFEIAARSDGDGGYSVPEEGDKITNYHQTFNLTKYDATDEITVHMFTNKGEEITIVLEKM